MQYQLVNFDFELCSSSEIYLRHGKLKLKGVDPGSRIEQLARGDGLTHADERRGEHPSRALPLERVGLYLEPQIDEGLPGRSFSRKTRAMIIKSGV